MKKKILDIAKKLFGNKITIDSKLGEPENWDSLGQLTLFMALESELEIKFTPEEIIENNSIKNIINLVVHKKNSIKVF